MVHGSLPPPKILGQKPKAITKVTLTRVATAQGKQGIWFLLFPDKENTGNLVLTQGKIC